MVLTCQNDFWLLSGSNRHKEMILHLVLLNHSFSVEIINQYIGQSINKLSKTNVYNAIKQRLGIM